MSQWIGDIVINTKQSVHQQPGTSHKFQTNLDNLYKIKVVGKYKYCTSKTVSRFVFFHIKFSFS